MKALVECFLGWLNKDPSDSQAWAILKNVGAVTLSRADRPSQEQREIEVLDIANDCRPEIAWDYDAAKRWFGNAKVTSYLDSRRNDLESYFLKQGFSQCLRMEKRAMAGRYRTKWYLGVYEIDTAVEMPTDDLKNVIPQNGGDISISYTVTAPGDIQLSWIGQMLLGNGAFKTRSWRGGIWAIAMIFDALAVLACVFFIFQMHTITRPIQTGDVVGIVLFGFTAWLIWRIQLRPLVWLLEDRISLATDTLVKMKEDSAHLDMAKDGEHRYIRLVRYSAVCPICAGNVELRYGRGANYRRLFGCCTEVPTEHVFTFDRVTKIGRRYV